MAASRAPRSPERARRVAVADLEAALGHAFRQREFLEEALTHPSASGPSDADNQRLEFLGDRVLGLLTAHALLDRFPSAAEGDLAPRFNALVRKETCADVAADLGVGPALRLGRSETTSGGRRKQALLADAMEALMAAVYLDGGLPAAAALHARCWGPRIDAQAKANAPPTDAKTALQERTQGAGGGLPTYKLEGRSGPDHEPSFRVSVTLANGRRAEGEGPSKREAERVAAATLLAALGDST